MTEKTTLPPVIRAHQHFPLLRRPRPPPKSPGPSLQPEPSSSSCTATRPTSSANTRSIGDHVILDSGLVREHLRATLTPVHPLPRHHPTPLSPHRHSSKHYKHSPHTQDNTHSPIHEHGDSEFICTRESISGVDNPVLVGRGPQFFPRRKTKRAKKHSPKRSPKRTEEGGMNFIKVLPPGEKDSEKNGGDFMAPEFEDLEEKSLYEPPATKLRGKTISRQNYLKLTGWFATHIPQQDTLNTLDITVDHCAPEGRRPYHQILLELERMIDSSIETSSGVVLTTGDERVEVRRTDDEEGEEIRWPTPSPGDIVFQSSTSRYFCGQGRSNSPFNGGGQPLICPSEVAILESMMDGGYRLSLKAHFLYSLPPLSPLSFTLTHLNISFNNLSVFPAGLLEMSKLKALQMRNNPIRDIPNGISRLEKLEIFCISFNILTFLPPGLFELSSLTQLDVSHNAIDNVSGDIYKLRNLRKLNVESNELIGLPLSLLSLPLSHLLIAGNYTHPALWKENCRAPPQTLIDGCCTVVSSTMDSESLPSYIKDIMHRRCQANVWCDFCKSPIFGPEAIVIKPVQPTAKNFPLKSVPVLYRACSLSCKTRHMHMRTSLPQEC